MPYALVANTKIAGAANGGTTPAIDTTGATLIVLGMMSNGGQAVPAITDSKSNTGYTALTSSVVGITRATIFYHDSDSLIVGSGHTFTWTRTSGFGLLLVAAFSGALASTPYDSQENGGTSTGDSTVQPGSITPTENDCLVVTALAAGAAITGSVSVDGGFTITDSNNFVTSTHFGGGLAYLIQTTAAAANPTWTWGTAAANLSARIASFKAAAVAGRTTKNTRAFPLGVRLGMGLGMAG